MSRTRYTVQCEIDIEVDDAMPEAEIANEIARRLQSHALAMTVYDGVYLATESFEITARHRGVRIAIGADVAYLMGAILHGHECTWPDDRPIVKILRRHFPDPGHPVWAHIAIDPEN